MSLFLQGISTPRNHLTANAVYGRQRTRNFNAGVRALLGDANRGQRLKKNVQGKNKQNAFGGRNKDMPANSTKYKVDPNPLDLEAHNPNMQPQPHDEAKEVRRYVKRKIALLSEKIARGVGAGDEAQEKLAVWKREKSAWQSWLTQLHHKEVLPSVRAEFISDFQNWLMGRGREIDHLRTQWYRTPITEGTVTNYLDAFINERHRFLAALTKLKQRAPRNIDEAYLYYKYIARQNPEEIPIKTFLSDWDKFSVLMDVEWQGEDHKSDPDVKVPREYPGAMTRLSSAAYQQAVNKNSKIGPKATIPILEKKGNQNRLVIPGVTPMSSKKLAEIEATQAPKVKMIEDDLSKYHLEDSEVSKWGKYSSKGGVGVALGGPATPSLVLNDPGSGSGGGPATDLEDEEDDENPDKNVTIYTTPPAQNETYGQSNPGGEEQPEEKVLLVTNESVLTRGDITNYLARNDDKGRLNPIKQIYKQISEEEGPPQDIVKTLRETHAEHLKGIEEADRSNEGEKSEWEKFFDEILTHFATEVSPTKVPPGSEEEAYQLIKNEVKRKVAFKGRNWIYRQVGAKTNRAILQHLTQHNVFEKVQELLDSHDLQTPEGREERNKFLNDYIQRHYDEETQTYNPILHDPERFQEALIEATKELGLTPKRDAKAIIALRQQYIEAYANHVIYTLGPGDLSLAGSAPSTLAPDAYDRALSERNELEALLSVKLNQVEELTLTSKERENAIKELEELRERQSKKLGELNRLAEERAALLKEQTLRAQRYEEDLKKLGNRLKQTTSEKERETIEKEAHKRAREEQQFRIQEIEQQQKQLSEALERKEKEQEELLSLLNEFQGTKQERDELREKYFKEETAKSKLQKQLQQTKEREQLLASQYEELGIRTENAEQLLQQQIHASNLYKEALIKTTNQLDEERRLRAEIEQGYLAKQNEAFEYQKAWISLRHEAETQITSLAGELSLTREAKEQAEQELYKIGKEKVQAEHTLHQALQHYQAKLEQVERFAEQQGLARLAEREIGQQEVERTKQDIQRQ
ncbi:MAG: hypothetical protein JSR46_02710, partial [Verrucomicrobia bacterium]|nr:hypothetical protein [Verrucomicrobiota bacterium]